MRHYIGIDGGGTQCRLLCVDEQSNKIDLVLGGSTNLASNTKQSVQHTLQQLIDEFYHNNKLDKKDCLGCCIGSAGIDTEAYTNSMHEIIRGLGFVCKTTVVNDGLLVLASAVEDNQGIVLISGTGSIAFGVDKKGKIWRSGGWGHFVDDGGSGYYIGKKALLYAFKAYDGRGIDTVLVKYLLEYFKIKDLSQALDCIYGEWGNDKSNIAQLSKLVAKGANDGDIVCEEIIVDAAGELYSLVEILLHYLDCQDTTIVLSGGIIQGIQHLKANLEELLKINYPNVKVVETAKEPVWGAIKLAMKK
ncbi:MAG: hypothetical protein FWF56_00095 [Firmicutes bacterium]|nr:hypothetical protein [Bacillota bacterium]